jgi:hypothetical protein
MDNRVRPTERRLSEPLLNPRSADEPASPALSPDVPALYKPQDINNLLQALHPGEVLDDQAIAAIQELQLDFVVCLPLYAAPSHLT